MVCNALACVLCVHVRVRVSVRVFHQNEIDISSIIVWHRVTVMTCPVKKHRRDDDVLEDKYKPPCTIILGMDKEKHLKSEAIFKQRNYWFY